MSRIKDAQWLGQHNDYLVDAGINHKLHPNVFERFKAMQRAAKRDGIDLQLVSSYRNFDRQLAIFNRKWRGEAPILDENSQPLVSSALSNTDKLHAILMWSALPGGSRHHWGTDFDVYDKSSVEQWGGHFNLVENEYEEGGPCYSLASWLEENMASFGFFRPFNKHNGGVAREPWHLSHADTAIQFEDARNVTALENALTQSDIEGKTTILSLLEVLYPRYVLNNGNDK